MRKMLLVLAAALAMGCSSFIEKQTNRFVDDGGRVISVVYGTSKKEHVSTFVTAKGTEAEFRSKLGVRVTFPGGKEVQAWQCMNILRSGTMYKTEDGRWMYHADGLNCSLFERLPDGSDYSEVFFGSLCTPRADER